MKKPFKFKGMLLAAGIFGATTIVCGTVALSSCSFGIADSIRNPNNNQDSGLVNPDLNKPSINPSNPIQTQSTPTLAVGIDNNPEIQQKSDYATITLKNNSTQSVNTSKASETSASFTFSLDNLDNQLETSYGTFSFVNNSVEGTTGESQPKQAISESETATTTPSEENNSSIVIDFSSEPTTPKTLSLKFTKADNVNFNIRNIMLQSSSGSGSTLTATKKSVSSDGKTTFLDVTLPAYHLTDGQINPFYSDANSLSIYATFLETQKKNWNNLAVPAGNYKISSLKYFSVNDDTYTFDDVTNQNLKLVGSGNSSKPNQYCIFLNGNHLKIQNMTIPADVQLYFIGNSLPNEVDSSTISKASINSNISKSSNSYVASVGNVSWSN